ncbi:hypothetical protein CSUI_004316 [Cystoisospora suis]|uniref:Uncharacterized protein n=1 Tax=Cystoisospora suis TaxID=483139 RepID=A0A2C6KZ69_9APIC|nr:hypothetical protein CSUI_004316 [Cystoisospora suis]
MSLSMLFRPLPEAHLRRSRTTQLPSYVSARKRLRWPGVSARIPLYGVTYVWEQGPVQAFSGLQKRYPRGLKRSVKECHGACGVGIPACKVAPKGADISAITCFMCEETQELQRKQALSARRAVSLLSRRAYIKLET